MSNSSILWLIPARGGSKGIPNKNIKDFCGIPLVNRAVKQAIDCASGNDSIFISTDSLKIKETVEKTGVTVPFLRPDYLATDTASTYDVILHVLQELRKEGKEFEKIVLLQPTSPLRTENDIRDALKLWNPDIDMVVSVCEAKTNPYFNAFEPDENGFLKISKGEGNITRRQDAPKVWEYNGAIYVITTASLLKGSFSSFKKIVPFIMPGIRSVDLDTPEDWDIAELRFKNLN